MGQQFPVGQSNLSEFVSLVELVKIVTHYLWRIAGVEIFSSPLHFWGWTSHHITGKRQVASFLDLRLRGVNGDHRQT